MAGGYSRGGGFLRNCGIASVGSITGEYGTINFDSKLATVQSF